MSKTQNTNPKGQQRGQIVYQPFTYLREPGFKVKVTPADNYIPELKQPSRRDLIRIYGRKEGMAMYTK